MRLPVFVKSLLGALGIVAVDFVMVKVCGFTIVRNIFLVLDRRLHSDTTQGTGLCHIFELKNSS